MGRKKFTLFEDAQTFTSDGTVINNEEEMPSDLDSYGKGRLAVIEELYDFCNKHSDFANNAKQKTDNEYKRAHLSGVVQTHIRIKQFLDNKKNNLKQSQTKEESDDQN